MSLQILGKQSTILRFFFHEMDIQIINDRLFLVKSMCAARAFLHEIACLATEAAAVFIFTLSIFDRVSGEPRDGSCKKAS